MDLEKLREQTSGRWLGIFESLGVNIREDGSHGPCCICGGRDRMRVDKNVAERGTYFCSQCQKQSGDGFDLIMGVLNIDFPAAMEAVASVVGHTEKQEPKFEPKMSVDDFRKVFRETRPATMEDPVGRYLKKRGLSVIPAGTRYHPACWDGKTKKTYPAMLNIFMGADDEMCTINRIFLSRGGAKADIDTPKKPYPINKTMTGGAVRLFEHVEGPLCIAEGIETAIAAHEDIEYPVWATLTATLMERFVVPKGVKELIIFGDNDENRTGQHAAYTLAARYAKEIKVSVLVPETVGNDWLDVLNQQKDIQFNLDVGK